MRITKSIINKDPRTGNQKSKLIQWIRFHLTVSSISSAILILLFVYTVLSKLADLNFFQYQLDNQVFSPTVSAALFFLLPLSQILAIVLLYMERYRMIGFIYSFGLLSIFTLYILLIIRDYFDRIPCICGGVITTISWEEHFVFNLFFLGIAIWGFVYLIKERRQKKQYD
ncbi:MauE/DoxX family redox-associated membrane protein [Sphingobacterium detergens]